MLFDVARFLLFLPSCKGRSQISSVSLFPASRLQARGSPQPFRAKRRGPSLRCSPCSRAGTSGPKTAAVTGDGSRTDDALSNLAELLPVLLTSGTGDLSQSLQAIASTKGGGLKDLLRLRPTIPTLQATPDHRGKRGSPQFLPALLTSDISDLSQGLQMIAGNGAGIERSSPPSANNSDASSNSGSSGKTGRSWRRSCPPSPPCLERKACS